MPRTLPSSLRLDANLVAGELWQGSFPPMDGRVRRCADVVVFTAKELQPPRTKYRGVTKLYAPFDDSGAPMSRREWATAKWAGQKVRGYLDRGNRVLVTCHMGLNRSGLVSAIALMLPPSAGARDVRTPSCLRADEAIWLVRQARGEHALSNEYFTRALRRLDGRFCRGRMPSFSFGFGFGNRAL